MQTQEIMTFQVNNLYQKFTKNVFIVQPIDLFKPYKCTIINIVNKFSHILNAN